MSPMPCGVRWRSLGEHVGGGSPLSGGFLPGKHEPSSVSAGKPGKKGCEILPPASLRIGDCLHGIGEIVGLHDFHGVMLPPRPE